MPITPCSDVPQADWLTTGDRQWQQLINFGPAGFPAYARLRFLPDPSNEGQSENDAEADDDAPPPSVQLRAALQVLAGHTGTADDCYFCLWDGWGWTVDGGEGAWTLRREHATAIPADFRVSSNPPAGWAVPAVLKMPGKPPHPPKVVIPHRAYFLFRGAAAEFDDWGAAAPGAQHAADMPDPAFIWPADHAWCVANDVDPHWVGIGADAAAVDQLLARPLLDAVRADPREDQPRYR